MSSDKSEPVVNRLYAWHDFVVRVYGLSISAGLALAEVDKFVVLAFLCISVAGPPAVNIILEKFMPK